MIQNSCAKMPGSLIGEGLKKGSPEAGCFKRTSAAD